MARVFFLGIVFYLVYRVIFDLLMPIYKTTRQVKRRFNDINEQMRQQQQQPFNQQAQAAGNVPPKTPAKAGDYIDFEEVKSQ